MTNSQEITVDDAIGMGLTAEEFERVCAHMGRSA